jgi:hypothetical protein
MEGLARTLRNALIAATSTTRGLVGVVLRRAKPREACSIGRVDSLLLVYMIAHQRAAVWIERRLSENCNGYSQNHRRPW